MSLTRPLTRSLTRALSNSELTQKLGGGFSIFALNPYLLFDARDSMIGTLENPTLDLDPSKPDSLNVITATRAGVATFTDVNGLIASAPANTVRVDHSLGYPAILVEPSATNLVPYSEDFSNLAWGKTGVSITDNAATAPNGSVTASKMTVDSSSLFHFIDDFITLGAEPYSFSCYLKADTANTASFFFTQSGNNGVLFDLQAGSVISVSGTGNTASIDDVGNGWFRCVVKNNGSADVFDGVRIGVANGALGSFQGNGTDSIYLWGAQLETGSVATSLIPTSGSTVTRAADDLEITGSAFSDFYNASEGTVYVEAVPSTSENYPHYASFNAGNASNRLGAYIESNSFHTYHCFSGGVQQAASRIGAPQFNELNRVSFSYRQNDMVGSANGGAEVSDTSCLMPLGNSKLTLGARAGNLFHLNGHIKRLIYWPYHSDSL